MSDMEDHEERREREAKGIPLGKPTRYAHTKGPGMNTREPVREPSQIITFVYRNWKGEIRERRVVPINIEFRADSYHKPAQWLLHAIDMDKGARRTFSFEHMITAPRKANNV